MPIPKRIISEEMIQNMEMLAITNPAMRDILEQAKVIYALAGSPDFFQETVARPAKKWSLYDTNLASMLNKIKTTY